MLSSAFLEFPCNWLGANGQATDSYIITLSASESSLFPLLYYSCLSLSSPVTLFMITRRESFFSGLCLEGFFFGKISVLCALASSCILAKKSNYSPGPGIYSGIFALYLRCLSDKSRTTTILSYALITLYVLSAATIISDLVSLIIEVSNYSICTKNIISYWLCRRVSGHFRFKIKLMHGSR